MADFKLIDHGSIVVLDPLNVKAEEWIAETAPDGAQFWGKGLVIEPRHVEDVALAAFVDGFEVEG